MAIQFPNLKYAYYDNADWLDNVSSMSWSGWVRWDDWVLATAQTVWSHKGATDKIQFYHSTSTGYVRAAVTAGGVLESVDDDTGVPTASTWYHWAWTWSRGSSTGFKIYRNGVLANEDSTSSQTANYNSGGSIDMYLNSYGYNSGYGRVSLEGCCWWPGTVLTANQIACLYWMGWPHLAGCPKPSAFYGCAGDLLTRLPDLSGNGRHIESGTITGPLVAVATSGKWEEPESSFGEYRQTSGGVTPPNPWTLFETTTHPTTTSTVTGLTNDTAYEFYVSALDEAGNESVASSTVEATPYHVLAVHTPRRRFLWG